MEYQKLLNKQLRGDILNDPNLFSDIILDTFTLKSSPSSFTL